MTLAQESRVLSEIPPESHRSRGPVAVPLALEAGKTEASGVKHVTLLLWPTESNREGPVLGPGWSVKDAPPPQTAEGRVEEDALLSLKCHQ